MASAKRDEFVKRVAESRSEEYLSPPVDISKSASDVQLGTGLLPNETTSPRSSSDHNSGPIPIEVNVPNLPQNKSPSKDETSRRNQHRGLLKQAYNSLLSAILDPIAYLHEKHNFELKVLTKIVKCDGCHGVLWGIHRQGLQCTKCDLSIHEKCRELVHENCTSSSGRKARRSLKLDDSTLQLELVNRYQDIKSTYPSYLNRVKEVFACVMSDDFRSDIKQTQQSFLQKSVKQIHTRLKIHVMAARDLLAKDSCGTSDPYVTIQCGFSRLKRTKTIKKNLNPVWNETLEFEFMNTADGIVSDSGNCGTKMIVRVWDEDQGIKAQLDRMLTNEQDDFLGQVVLDLNDLSVDMEETYRLQPRHDGSHVSGFLVMKIDQKVVETLSNYRTLGLGSEKSLRMIDSAQAASYLDEYRCLHRHLFNFLFEASDTSRDEPFSQLVDTTWLLHCFPKSSCNKGFKINYFKGITLQEPELNLMLKHFANKHAISERQKQIFHLECFYTFFFDSVYYNNMATLSSVRRLYPINCQLLDYMSQLVLSVSSQSLVLDPDASTAGTSSEETSTVNSSPAKKSSSQIVGSFVKKTLWLPLKIILVLSNFRLNFAVRYRVRRGGRIELLTSEELESSLGETAIDELRELVILLKAVCGLVEKLAVANSTNVARLEHVEAKFLQKFSINKSSFGYGAETQYELIKQAIEKSLIACFYNLMEASLPARQDAMKFFEPITKENSLLCGDDERRLSSRSTDSSVAGSYVKSHYESDNCSPKLTEPNIHEMNARIELLMGLISKKLPVEIQLNEQLYLSAFYSFNGHFNQEFEGGFRQFCARVFFKQFIFELQNSLKSDLALRMHLDLIKQHLNLHLLVKRFMIDNGLNQLDKKQFPYTTALLSELFQPFLLEYIRLQEDQFIKYAHKIYDVSRINQLAEEIAHMIEDSRVILLSTSSLDAACASPPVSMTLASGQSSTTTGIANMGSASLPHELVDKYSIDLKSTKAIYDLENFYSASVTDFFTIMHELLQTLLSFDSTDAKANLPHQMGFVNLIKSKLLGYSAHVKKEFQKIYSHARDQRNMRTHLVSVGENDANYPSNQLTITSCILMNNFQKTVDFLDEIEPKLTNKSKLNRMVVDQLESIRLILKEDLHNMIVEYAHEYEEPLRNACKSFQLKMYMDRTIGEVRNGAHQISHMKYLIEQSLFNIFNDRFMICKIILFDDTFKQLLEQIFKLTVKCVESSIILSGETSYNDKGMNIEMDSSESSSSSSPHGHESGSLAAASYGILNKIGTFFQRTNVGTSEKTSRQWYQEKSLLNDFQHKTIQQYLKNVVEFFSGDEEFLKKDFLVSTNEYQSALRTLDLYLNSPNQLISTFVKSQNVHQNNIDFKQCLGKVRVQIEVKQNLKQKNELIVCVRVLEAASVSCSLPQQQPLMPGMSQLNGNIGTAVSCNPITIYVELYAFGPFSCGSRNWPLKIFPATYLDPIRKSVHFGEEASPAFEFKISLSSSDGKRLAEACEAPSRANGDERKILESYELQIVMREIVAANGQAAVIGSAVFNFAECVEAAFVWKRLIREEQLKDEFQEIERFDQRIKPIDLNSLALYSNMDFWVSLRPRLRFNDIGYKILKVLEKHTNDGRAIEFVKIKTLFRIFNNNNYG